MAIPWKLRKIEERTTLAARPPQYACIPNLQVVSVGSSAIIQQISEALTYKMKLTKHFTITTNHVPYIPKVALLIIEKPRW